MTNLRPSKHLAAAMRLYPSTSKMVDMFRRDRGTDILDWPAWCFLPMAAWYAIVSQDNFDQLSPDRRLPLYLIPDVGKLSAIGTWRYSQGIYQLDADLQEAVADSIIAGDIPSEVLFRLPEWCVYIETAGKQWFGNELYGFWAHLEFDTNTQRNELRLLLDTEEGLIPIPVHIGQWTVTEAIDRATAEARKQLKIAKLDFRLPDMDEVQQLAMSINPLISMLLYLCSDEPDIDDERVLGSSPSRPQPVKTKKGWRLFPAEKPRVWTVGAKIGEQLRQANADISADTKRGVKVHLRKGHWHGFWTGQKTEKQKFVYKWLMPMIVGSKNE
ncbi:hypothetical protein [Methylomonas sp. AM2-LC]|uniref:AcrVA2 family anti-CRISPR protein n=1 Tax=Methylomonas sp. AM2-LC TaxID=3153301 RepID=UPI003265887B